MTRQCSRARVQLSAVNLPVEADLSTGAILGIHSNVVDGDFTGGHAWLTVTRAGKTVHYGLWPDSHPRTRDNGDASDIRIGLEAGSTAKASRYYTLSAAQAARFDTLVKANVHWFYTHNCSSWASDMVAAIVREDVDADDWMGFETPRELGRNIQRLEARNPTSVSTPKPLRREPATSIATSGTGTAGSSRTGSVGSKF